MDSVIVSIGDLNPRYPK